MQLQPKPERVSELWVSELWVSELWVSELWNTS